MGEQTIRKKVAILLAVFLVVTRQPHQHLHGIRKEQQHQHVQKKQHQHLQAP